MKVLVDMNLSPAWVPAFQTLGLRAVHWSQLGDKNADDEEIFRFAAQEAFIIVTHDLDFARIVALARARRPSLVLLRSRRLSAERDALTGVTVMLSFRTALEEGAVISLLGADVRVRMLPIG